MNRRYSKQIILPEIGEKGQTRLSGSKAIVVGAGGLGSIVLYYLAAAGIGQIKIIDSDTVALDNLNRQFIYNEADVGAKKTTSAMEKIRSFNSGIEISVSDVRLNPENVNELVSGGDIVVACVDNKETRLLLNDCCVKKNIPLTDGGINGFEGYVFTVIPGLSPCFRCVFPAACEKPGTNGVIGAAAGVIGSMMSLQAIKILLDIKLDCPCYYVDLTSFRVLPVNANKNPNCPICGK